MAGDRAPFPRLWTSAFWKSAWDTPAPSIGKITSLDGFRGAGVYLVLNEHFSNGHIHFAGHVALGGFFVLSGFLITSILLFEHQQTGTVNRRLFYQRRAARLLPALWIGLSANLFLGLIGYFDLKYVLIEVAGNMVYLYLVSYAILYLIKGKVTMPQLWTLNVEEWFYVLWFLGLSTTARNPQRAGRRFRNMLFVATAILVVLSILALGKLFGLESIFIPNPVSLMLFGCVLAVYRKSFLDRSGRGELHPAEAWFLRWSTTIGVAITIPLYTLDALNPNARGLVDGLAAIPALLVIIGLALDQSPRVARFLSWKPFVHVGQIIYGMYVYHFTIFLLFNGPDIPAVGSYPRHPIWLNILGLGSLTYLVALASWHFVERPIVMRYRNLKPAGA